MVTVEMERIGWVQETIKRIELTELGNQPDQKLAKFSIKSQKGKV